MGRCKFPFRGTSFPSGKALLCWRVGGTHRLLVLSGRGRTPGLFPPSPLPQQSISRDLPRVLLNRKGSRGCGLHVSHLHPCGLEVTPGPCAIYLRVFLCSASFVPLNLPRPLETLRHRLFSKYLLNKEVPSALLRLVCEAAPAPPAEVGTHNSWNVQMTKVDLKRC